MTRRYNCLLPCPSDKGEAYLDSIGGFHWTYDSFFDGIDSEIEDCGGNQGNLHALQQSRKPQLPSDDMEKLEAVFDGLDCPPMDEAYFNCEANFNWMMDGNLFDNDAPADSKATKTYNINKGSPHRKGKPQSLVVPKLHGNGKPQNLLVPKLQGKGKPENLIVPKMQRKGKPQNLIAPKLQPICKDRKQNKVACGRGKDIRRVIDLYSGSEILKKPSYGEDKRLKILEVPHKHTDSVKAEFKSCPETRSEKVKSKKRKIVAAASIEMPYESKLEITKRKLQENYQQSEKLRKVQLIGLKDVPKPCNKSVSSFGKRICKSSTVKQRLAKKLKVMGRKVC